VIRAQGHGLVYYQFPALSAERNLRHGFFTRLGGVSHPPYASLNVGASVGDDPEAVRLNRERCFAALGFAEGQVVTPNQVHGTTVVRVGAADGGRTLEATDGLVTDEWGVALFLRFADCVPIVFYNARQQAIGLAHAGWRGVAENVAAATVEAMQTAFGSDPRDLWAGIGPCISVDQYRVGPEVIDAVRAAVPPTAPIIRRQPDGSTHLDLNAAVTAQLRACGLTQIEDAQLCTASRTDDWFSHRAENGATGRFGVVIGLR